jgi:type IV secretory pathway VirB3-like protein
MKIPVCFVLLVVAWLASAYAGFCLLGGPEGAILSKSSFVFGVPSLLLVILLVYTSMKLVPVKPYFYALAVAPILVWLSAISISQMAGFNVWLYGTPILGIALLAYWIDSQSYSAPEDGTK